MSDPPVPTAKGEKQPKSRSPFDRTAETLRKNLKSAGLEIKSVYELGQSVSSNDDCIHQFKGMFRTVDRYWMKYEDLWEKLLSHYEEADRGDEFPSQSDTNQKLAVKRYYTEINTTNEKLLVKTALEGSVGGTNPSGNVTVLNEMVTPSVNLPQIDLPHYDGSKIIEWPRYRDTFRSLIHDDKKLSPTQKFHYLKASLSGSAYSVISEYRIEDGNFELAWAALLLAYDKKRVLAASYLNEILSFRPLQGKPNAQACQLFLTKISDSVSAFRQLEIPNSVDFVLFHMAVQNLDSSTREQFELAHKNNEFPSIDNLTQFIRDRRQALQLASNTSDIPTQFRQEKPNKERMSSKDKSNSKFSLVANAQGQSGSQSQSKNSESIPCCICGASHSLVYCVKFYSMTAPERLNSLKKWKGCKNCLKSDHNTHACSSKWDCRFCHRKHNALLHIPTAEEIDSRNASSEATRPPKSDAVGLIGAEPALSSTAHEVQVVLGTVVAEVLGTNGRFQTIRAVIDSASHFSFITSKCLNRLGLTAKYCPKKVSGIGQTLFDGIKGQVKCVLRPRNKVSPQLTLDTLVVKNITSYLPTIQVPPSIANQYKGFKLADPTFYQPSAIDILIGGDAFSDVWLGCPVTVGNDLPKLFNTIFGFVVVGRYMDKQTDDTVNPVLFAASTEETLGGLSFDLQRFWESEEPVSTLNHKMTEDEVKCEEHFLATHHRTPSGRFVVRLPFRAESVTFPDTKGTALRRFHYLENKLNRCEDLKIKYTEFMSEYLSLGHMTLTCEPSNYLIPHHAISKIDRGEVKLRVVFDASSRSSRRPILHETSPGSPNMVAGSLNENLLVGRKLQNDIKTIIMNFRSHEVVFVTDIVKCYRQILVEQPDRSFQHIYWRSEPSTPIQKYELNTLTYGMTCSPYLALRCLQQLCEDEKHRFPTAAKVLWNDSYIDDIVSGSSSLQEAKDLQIELVNLLKSGGFELSKWASNRSELLEGVLIPNKSSNSDVVSLHEKDDDKLKILGLQWETGTDNFTYVTAPPKVTCTKRSIYSTTAKVYDPIGFLAPTIIQMKILMQDLWKEKLSWDEAVPIQLAARWRSMLDNLSAISQVKIPRFLGRFNQYRVVGFADASEKAYCAALFLQMIDTDMIQSKLIIAKTKVAPVKPLTIPRLELCAALLLAKLYESISAFLNNLKGEELPSRFFTDSTTVLGWIKIPTYKLQTFVCHRISEINRIIPSDRWRHVVSSENPADCGSRGLPPEQLATFTLWWAGPHWLTSVESEWPSSEPDIDEELPEIKNKNVSVLTATENDPHFIKWMEKYSSYWKLLRAVARIKRCLRNQRDRKNNVTTMEGDFSLEEINQALIVCIKLTQLFYLLNGSVKNTNFALNKFSKLHPFVDKNEILRVGGRLRHSDLTQDQKYPILLPPEAHFTKILVDYFHKLYLHPGPNALQALIQLRYWVPSLRRVVRQRTFFCLKCYRFKAKNLVPMMGDLPYCRVLGGRAFLFVGIDFAGPFIIRDSLRRKAQQSKCYLCLFVCMASKALHLEVVSSLSTEAFLAALARFVARRGLPAEVYSDCGSNFVGASRTIRECLKWFNESATIDAIAQYATSVGISWNFNPPHAPHFGGLWEAGVKSSKTLLRKIVGDAILTFEELTTVFAKIEALLNSRPLCPLSQSPEETEFLSPGHFLVGRPLLAIPQPTLEDTKDNRLSRWQIVKKMEDTFWSRWRQEYLSTLQSRVKWDRPTSNIEVGDLVLLKGDANVLQWPLARVMKVHPGADGTVRVATIKTAASTYQRPVVKLVPLLPLKSDPYQNCQT